MDKVWQQQQQQLREMMNQAAEVGAQQSYSRYTAHCTHRGHTGRHLHGKATVTLFAVCVTEDVSLPRSFSPSSEATEQQQQRQPRKFRSKLMAVSAARQTKVMSCFAAHKLSGSFLFSLSLSKRANGRANGRLVIIEFVSYTTFSSSGQDSMCLFASVSRCLSVCVWCALFVANWQYPIWTPSPMPSINRRRARERVLSGSAGDCPKQLNRQPQSSQSSIHRRLCSSIDLAVH